MFKYVLALLLLPYFHIVKYRFNCINQVIPPFIEVVSMPNVILFMVLPIWSSILIAFEKLITSGNSNYSFGFLSWVSVASWIILIVYFIFSQKGLHRH